MYDKLKAFIALFLGIYPLLVLAEPSISTREFRVGAILPLTDHYSFMGQEFQKGMNLALKREEVRAANLRIIYEDEALVDKQKATTALKKLASIDKVHSLLVSFASTAPALAANAAQSKLNLIVLWDSNRDLYKLGTHIHSIGFGTETAGEGLASATFDTLKARTAAVIAPNDEWAETISHAFVKRWERLGGTVVMNERVDPENTEFAPLITRARRADVLFSPVYANSLHAFVRQARQLKYPGRVLLADSLTNADITTLGPLLNSVIYAQIWIDSHEFRQAWQREYGPLRTQLSLATAGLGYDVIQALAAAKRSLDAVNKDLSYENITKALLNVDLVGATGAIKLGDRNGDLKREKIYEIKDGVIVEFK